MLVPMQIMAFPQSAGNSDNVYYTYDYGTEFVGSWGTSKQEVYDVAIKVVDKNLAGTVITGVEIPFGNTAHLANLKVWISKELSLDGKVNAPDVTSQDAALHDGMVTVTFNEPYTLTEEGAYVGYSFEVSELDGVNGSPIKSIDVVNEHGFYVHTSRTYIKWMNRSEQIGRSLAMRVLVNGVPHDAAGIAGLDNVEVQAGSPSIMPVKVRNHGASDITYLEYRYSINGQEGTGCADLYNTPIRNYYNMEGKMNVQIPAMPDAGSYPLTVTITKVNDMPNNDVQASAQATVTAKKMLVRHRPVMEEYTGTWCGYCPRGLVALKVLSERYPDNFIGISYHAGNPPSIDPMQIMPSYNFPTLCPGYPFAAIDRVVETDPYHGSELDGFGIEMLWLNQCGVAAPADVSVKARLSEDKTKVVADATVAFPEPSSDNRYLVAYVLTANGLHGDSKEWWQANYFPNSGNYNSDPNMDEFTKGENPVKDLLFDDVAISVTAKNGEAGSLPAQVEAEQPYTHSHAFTLGEAVNMQGESLVQDVNKLFVVALLVDSATGRIANACKAPVVTDPTGISSPADSNTGTGRTIYYTPSGRQLDHPCKGVNIVRRANGKVVKVML